jgi:predicted MFS family arabinose efflux permease
MSSSTTRRSTAPVSQDASPRRLSHPVAFGAIAAIFILFMAASAAPSPLYVVYQHEWAFSASTLTVVFAVYVVGLLGSLLVLGALSDHIGRRPVLAIAVGLEAVALILFITAGNVDLLLVARLVQGIGLAVGAVGCGALVQFAAAPTRLVFVLLLAGLVLAAIVVAVMPETSARRPGARASLIPKVSIPSRLRPEVYALLPVFIATWAVGGLYLSLGPSVAATIFGLQNHLVGGLAVALLCAPAAATSFALRAWSTPRLLTLAAFLLAVGMVLTLLGIASASIALAMVGTLTAGVGFGASALGCFGTLARIAAPHERGELFAVAFVMSYLAFALPAVAAGFASTSAGLRDTTVVFGIVVALLAAIALVVERIRAS